ncbi:multidrug efflux pump subunit AcrA (membrane-fusion protein) [Pseudomonas hunanensis]|uniref:Multidrug efflux pump subunit AcrA (Membrane-fusion protein) n=1 Tax=Pseudomonas hunanensis TaxID=1247546 RepID=A0ACC6K2S7_9PSED|nr:multidrug efflux pump subunit AcrA (membrane-fusion protein) [Pseudomonas hunanensis]
MQPASEGRQRPVQQGQRVGQGMPLLALLDLSRLQVLAAVEERDLGQVQQGMPVSVSGEGFSGQVLQGRVVAIGLQARPGDGQGAWYDLLVELDAQPDPLALGVRLGMSAQVLVVVYRNEQGLAVPIEALRVGEQGERYVLYRAGADQPARRVEVGVGAAVIQGIEVQGLAAGYVLIQ